MGHHDLEIKPRLSLHIQEQPSELMHHDRNLLLANQKNLYLVNANILEFTCKVITARTPNTRKKSK